MVDKDRSKSLINALLRNSCIYLCQNDPRQISQQRRLPVFIGTLLDLRSLLSLLMTS